MENLKVKVENNIDELVSLFGELGCKYFNHTCSVKNYMIFQNGKCFFVKSKKEFNAYDCKEITIQQLRDMVVLKRNSIDDATHEFKSKRKVYVSSEDICYLFSGKKWEMFTSGSGNVAIRPIEKKEMKEYLRKNSDGKYILEVTDEREAKEPHAENWIEVPKGCDYLISNLGVNSFIDSDMFAKVKPKNILWSRKEMKEFLVNYDSKWTLQLLDSDTEENSYCVAVPKDAIEARLNKSRTINFIRLDGCWMNEKTNGEWFMSRDHSEHEIIWQRSEAESLNDQYAEIEKVRQDTVKVTIDELKHGVYKKDVSHLDSIDVYRVLELFNVQSHAVGHAIKKLLCSGGRGAKDEAQDIQEAIDSLIRYQEMKNEDKNPLQDWINSNDC